MSTIRTVLKIGTDLLKENPSMFCWSTNEYIEEVYKNVVSLGIKNRKGELVNKNYVGYIVQYQREAVQSFLGVDLRLV